MQVVHLEPWSQDELPDFFLARLNELSDLTLVPSNEKFTLEWGNGYITPTVVSLLLQILNHPLPREQTQNGEESKWDFVFLTECRFPRPSSITQLTPDQLYSRHNDVITLLSTLMSRSQQFYLIECPQLLAFVTRIPQIDQFEMKSLYIEESTFSSDFQYERLGDMIQRSAQLTELDLSLNFGEVPQEMLESLANAIYLRKLRMRDTRNYGSFEEEAIPVRSHLVVHEDGNGMVARLLQNPQSRLQHLDLGYLGLDDRHFIALVGMLPTSRLKYLNVASNNIQSPGLSEFARLLPRIHSLKTIILVPNPGLSYYGHCTSNDEEFVDALVHGMTLNHVLEEFEDEDNVDPSTLEEYPQGSLLLHYLDINRAGRRILAADSVIPLGLWPHVLERAGTRVSFTRRHYIYNDVHGRRADAIYFFLQSCPRLFDKRVHPIDGNTTI